MKKFLLFILACLLLPAVGSAANKYLNCPGGSYSWNPYDYRVAIPYKAVNPNDMTADDSFTYSAWLYINSVTSNANLKEMGGVIASFDTATDMDWGGVYSISIGQANTTLTVRGDDGDNTVAAPPTLMTGTMAKTTWKYVTVVVDNPNLKLSVYIDGALFGESTLKEPVTASAEDNYFFTGGLTTSVRIDQVELYNKALSAEEVAKAQNNPYAFESLRALYTFDEPYGSTKNQFANVLGNGNDVLATHNKVTHGASTLTKNQGFKNVTLTASTSNNLSNCDRVVKLEVTVDPDIQRGKLSVNSGGTAIEGTAMLTSGSTVTITATPDEGCYLVHLYAITYAGKEVITGNTYTVDKPVTFTAEFTDTPLSLSVLNEANLDYSISLYGQPVTDLEHLVPDNPYILALNVPEDVTLKYVSLGDKIISPELDGTYHFTLTESTTLFINAEAKARYTVTYENSEKGTFNITAGGAEVASGATLLERTEIQINVVPAEGYAVSAVYLNGTAINNGAKYTMLRDIEITADFLTTDLEHCTPVSVNGGTTTATTGRSLTKAVISDGNNSLEIANAGTYANAAFGNASGRPVYDAAAVVPQFIVEPGATVTLTTTGAGEWLHTFIYLDTDLNGLDKQDLVWSNYVDEEAYVAIPCTASFTVPRTIKTGVHRMRCMVNWDNNQGPCEYGQSGKDNGEVIFDVDFVVSEKQVAAERTVTVLSENEALGTVAILDPATDTNSVTTKFRYVTVKATPAQGYSFINWTNAEGKEVSASATFEYEGADDIELTAHFGYSVAYSSTGSGTMLVATAAGTNVANGAIVPVSTGLLFTLTPAAGKAVTSFTVNGEEHVADLVSNQYTMALESDVVAAAVFADFTAHVSWTVRGNGDVEAGYAWNDNGDGAADTFESGDAISTSDFNYEGGLTLFVYPGQSESGDYETIETVTAQIGDADPRDVTADVEMGDDSGLNGDGLLESGAPFRYYTISELPSADMMIVFVFTQDGASSSIDNIFADDDTDAPTLYYNIDGVRVNGNALTPGIYIVKKGKKTAKVYVM